MKIEEIDEEPGIFERICRKIWRTLSKFDRKDIKNVEKLTNNQRKR